MADSFQPKFVDLVRNYTTTIGTSDFVLGPAVNGFASFPDALQTGDGFYYSAVGVDNPADTEVGRGTLLANGVISRDPVSGKKTNFKSGTKAIALIAAAEWFGEAHAFVGSVSAVGQSLVSAVSAADARAALALDHVAVNPAWYGLVEGDDPANGPANSVAFAALMADLATTNRFRVVMPAGTYWFSDTIDIGVGNLVLEGAASGGLEEASSILKFPAGVTGIRIQNDQSSGGTVRDGAAHSSGGGTVLRNLALEGSFTTSEAEAHGVQLRRKATIENLTISNFEGDGIYVGADLGAASGATPPYGNDNCSSISRVSVSGCRNGICIDGADANAITLVMPNLNLNRQWGYSDSSFLGNTIVGGQIGTNGVVAANDGVTIGASEVSYSANIYGAIVGQEAWCSTNAPSGTTADNQGWYYIASGGPTLGKPAWSSGMLVRAGGCVHDDSLTAACVYTGVYAEDDQGKAQIVQKSLVVGGLLASWCYQNPAGANGAAIIRGDQNNGALVHVEPALECVSGVVAARLGAAQGNATNRILNAVHPTYCAAGYSLQFATGGSTGDIRFSYSDGAANAWWVTMPGTGAQFGTGASVPHAFSAPKLVVQDNSSLMVNARRLMIDTAAPASGAHGQGEWCLYRGATAGLIGWKCIVAGTPGTWEAVYSGFGTGPVGYATGAGGAVTQATSKSSAVTLNKLCGQITMNAAALAANTAVSFTVNNSQVAATDAIDLVLASGNAAPGTYNYQVDKVSAGSIVVWVKNISGGSLSEALVFNFAVKKAVAA
jgi:hypothetical protein